MQGLAQWKFLVGTLMLLFACSANGLAFGSHSAAESFLILVAAHPSETSAGCSHEHSHHHSGPEHQHTDDDGHCCHLHHSHDLQGAPALVFSRPLQPDRAAAVEPIHFLPEVYLERFIPPQNRS